MIFSCLFVVRCTTSVIGSIKGKWYQFPNDDTKKTSKVRQNC